MFDYKLLEALEMVVRVGSFEGAARRLHLTQSAISQRIRQLEERFGKVLLLRSNPVRPTPDAERLLAHIRQVQVLEAEVESSSDQLHQEQILLRIGVNADSLALGLVAALGASLISGRVLLECLVDDEANTLDLLRSGDAVGCISTRSEAVAGCSVVALGMVPYVLVATTDFAATWFANGLEQSALRAAPAVVFSHRDSLHRRWLRESYGLQEGDYPCHVIPECHALYMLASKGAAYALVPWQQAQADIATGHLLHLGYSTSVSLYWHAWQSQTPQALQLVAAVTQFFAQLQQPHCEQNKEH